MDLPLPSNFKGGSIHSLQNSKFVFPCISSKEFGMIFSKGIIIPIKNIENYLMEHPTFSDSMS